MRPAMAPARKKAKRATTRRASTKSAKKAGKKAGKKAAKKATKRTTKKAAKRTTAKKAKKGAKKATKKAPAASKNVKFSTRKKGTFSTTDLYDQLQARYPDMKKTEVRRLVDDVLETVNTAIKKTDRVRLKGVGTITKKKIPARKGGKLVKNPFTGEMVKQKPKPASVKVKLNPAQELKQA